MGTNTGLGIGIGIPFKNNALGGDKPYFPPELKARMIGVWTSYGKKNTDADRNIIKNKIPNAGGDLEILNSAYKLNSGFGEYKVDFLDWTINSPFINERTSFTFSSFNDTNNDIITVYQRVPAVVQSFKIKTKLRGRVLYRYYVNKGDTISVSYYEVKEGINILPDSVDPTSVNGKAGFVLKGLSSIKVEQIPSFEGAFVTDGIDDLITSTKTLQEMLGGSNEITVVSMIHQIGLIPSQSYARNNYFIQGNDFLTNTISAIGKIGIYGYKGNLSNIAIVNDILGDKKDYSVDKANPANIDSVFSVNGTHSSAQLSSVAWYWTIIANKVLTTDEINQVIAYFNLDKTLKPDILCNITKQGITNDNHADFNDKLIDYSGNGRDIQMNNLAWKGGSGIAAKQYETFKDWTSESSSTSIITQIDEFTRIVESTTNGYWVSRIRRGSDLDKVYDPINVYLYQDNNFLVHECEYEVDGVKYSIPINESVGKGYHKLEMYTKDRYTELPENAENVVLSEWYFPKSTKGSIKYSIIPSCKGGILLDGINDFGKVTGMPVYKDFTVVTDREIFANIGAISSKNNPGAFVETAGNSVYSFGQATSGLNFISTRSISYLSKYSYCGQSITAGAAEDGTDMWLGTIRDNDSRFFNGAIYSLMSFPYSMSEFLIERQLKKHKLGTLYPGMVEFRPVIKANTEWKYLEIYQGDNRLYNLSEHDDKTGIYLEENSSIEIYVKPYTGQKVSKIVYNGTSYIDLENNGYGYYYITVPVTKSPQKIGITIEWDENYVQWNPVVESNVAYKSIRYYKLGDSGSGWIGINIGDYIPIGRMIMITIDTANTVDELVSAVSSQLTGIDINGSNGTYNITGTLTSQSPQNINITIDEYIRYEDIVQPYPVLLRFNDENGNEVSWGGKFKVGSTITRIGSAIDSNLLPNIYNIFGLLLNGNQITNSKAIVEKTMVFKPKSTYIFDNNEPKCILSPRLLRIPNSSYKILGHIPDISGHGNHGKINNSAYASMSGANGYLLDFKTFTTGNSSLVNIKDDSRIEVININKEKSTTFVNLNKSTSISLSSWKIKVTGMKSGDTLGYYYSESTDATLRSKFDIKSDGIYSLPSSIANSNNIGGIAFDVVAGADSAYRIEQIGEYEGAYCLDGVDDFVTIPTVTGGKQVLMKVNWDKTIADAILYDQRGYPNEFAIYNADVDNNNNNPVFAYQARNNGQTYIDGILNKNIKASELRAITHNITITNELSTGTNTSSPVIGSNRVHDAYFTNMALYDFMLFDNISRDDKIKELNEYVGIEGNTEWRKTE